MTVASRRRPTGVLLLVTVAVVGAAAAATALRDRGPDDPVADLRRRVASGPDTARFTFRYERGGTDVLGCLLPNRAFTVDVDGPAGVAVFRAVTDGETIAMVRPRAVFVSRRLFETPPFATEWLSLGTDASTEISGAVRRAVGADLADYLLAPGVPASGRALVRAALDIARDVTGPRPVLVDGIRADRYRITVDGARFAAAAADPGATTTTPRDDAVPRFDVALDRRSNRIVHVAVSPQPSGGRTATPDSGWTLEYENDAPSLAPPPRPSDVTAAAGVDVDALSPARRECRLAS